MRMVSLPDQDVRARLPAVGARVLEARADAMASTAIDSRTYYVTKPEGPAGQREPA